MFRQILIAAAIGAAMSGSAAGAKDNTPPAANTPAPASSDKTRYCIKDDVVTGTMLSHRSCRTLAEWKALGIDPTRKQH